MILADRTPQLAELHGRVFGRSAPSADERPSGEPTTLSDDELLTKIRSSKQGDTFSKLFDNGDTSLHKGDDSAADLALCCILAFWTGRDRDRMDRLFRQSALCRKKWERADYRDRTIQTACDRTKEVYEPKALILDPGDPLRSAREFLTRHLTINGVRAAHHQQGVFYHFDAATSVYRDADEASVRAAMYRFLDSAKAWDEEEQKLKPFKPTRTKVESVLDALRAECNLPTTRRAPSWLTDDSNLDPRDVLPCRNGLLHIPTRQLFPATPNLFALNGVDVTFDPHAPEPVEWLTFLRSVWPDDRESVDTLQELLGYVLTPDTRFQKIGMVIGPKRSGKGTIGKISRALVGQHNTCNPTLASFGRDFGKQVLIDKTLAIIPDARLSGRTDPAMVAETLLSISGDDPQTIPRKFLPDWNGQLPTRFVILSNELPKIGDASGALASRFVLLVMTRSFYGQEDLRLFGRIVTELPAILNWALEGRDRLYTRGYFVQPKSATQMLREFEDLNSPISVFVREHCQRTTGETEQGELFLAWRRFCAMHGIEHVGTVQTFGRNLRAAVPGIVDQQRRTEDGTRRRFWQGLVVTKAAGGSTEAAEEERNAPLF